MTGGLRQVACVVLGHDVHPGIVWHAATVRLSATTDKRLTRLPGSQRRPSACASGTEARWGRHDRLVAGLATPVLTTHLWMTAVVYPIFALTIIAFLIAAGRDRVLGSWWIAWLGIIGVTGHGIAGPLVVIWGIQTGLFALIVLLAIWMILAACWPATASVRDPEATSVA